MTDDHSQREEETHGIAVRPWNHSSGVPARPSSCRRKNEAPWDCPRVSCRLDEMRDTSLGRTMRSSL